MAFLFVIVERKARQKRIYLAAWPVRLFSARNYKRLSLQKTSLSGCSGDNFHVTRTTVVFTSEILYQGGWKDKRVAFYTLVTYACRVQTSIPCEMFGQNNSNRTVLPCTCLSRFRAHVNPRSSFSYILKGFCVRFEKRYVTRRNYKSNMRTRPEVFSPLVKNLTWDVAIINQHVFNIFQYVLPQDDGNGMRVVLRIFFFIKYKYVTRKLIVIVSKSLFHFKQFWNFLIELLKFLRSTRGGGENRKGVRGKWSKIANEQLFLQLRLKFDQVSLA